MHILWILGVFIMIMILIFILKPILLSITRVIPPNKEHFRGVNSLDSLLPKVYYINLNHRNDRNKHILREFQKIRYPAEKITRIDAILDKMGSTGCGLSHIKSLELTQDQTHVLDYVMIIEDDFTWKYNISFTRKILFQALSSKVDWNVILLACNGHKKAYSKYLDRVENCQTTSGYIIKLDYIPKLLNIWRKDMKYRDRHNPKKNSVHERKTCIDQSWKQLQHDNWFITKPVLGKQMDSYSDIEHGFIRYNI